jgi:hypothetical protein
VVAEEALARDGGGLVFCHQNVDKRAAIGAVEAVDPLSAGNCHLGGGGVRMAQLARKGQQRRGWRGGGGGTTFDTSELSLIRGTPLSSTSLKTAPSAGWVEHVTKCVPMPKVVISWCCCPSDSSVSSSMSFEATMCIPLSTSTPTVAAASTANRRVSRDRYALRRQQPPSPPNRSPESILTPMGVYPA